MADEQISVDMKGSGLSLSGFVTLKQAIEMLRIASLHPDEVEGATRSNKSPTDAKASPTSLSLPELINRVQPATSPETITVIATWLMDAEGLESVTRADVGARYRDARLPPPGNLPRDFAKAIRKGFLAPVRGNNDQFYVTRTGRSLLDSKEGS